MSDGRLAVAYVRLALADPEAAGRFVADILGLPPGPRIGATQCLRAGQHQNDLSLLPLDAGPSACGIEFPDQPTLDAAAARLRDAGFDLVHADPDACRHRQVDACFLTLDGSGNAVDLVLRPHMNGRRCHLLRDSGITGLHGAALRSRDIQRDIAFWQAVGGRVADQVGDITYIGLDKAHHRIALHPSDGTGILYTAFAVEGLDQLMQASYFANDRQVRILQGPGRQPASGLVFLHLAGPEGTIFTLVTPPDASARPAVPRRFLRTVDGLCAWGSRCDAVPELQAEDGI